jgi:hypothetical protein
MVDYQLGKIYTIRSSKSNDIYIGSCCQSLAVRFGEHKRAYIKQKLTCSKLKSGPYKIFDCGVDDAYIEIIECYPCNNIEELKKRQGEIIRTCEENCINKHSGMGLLKEEQIKLFKEKQKKTRLNVYTCLCGEIVKTHLKDTHQMNSKIHDDYREKMWYKGLYPDGTPPRPLIGYSIGTK